MNNSLRWLFLDLNSYFASVEQQEQPKLRGKPVGVVPMLGVNSTCCLAASYEAKAFGVQTGTNVAEARLRCPDIQFVPARHDLYVRYHHAILEAVESCLPIHQVLSIDEMVGRLYGREQEPEEAVRLAKKTKAAICRHVGVCLKSSVGLAPNRFLAKVAGEMQKPDGLTVLESHQLPHALFRLTLRDLPGIGPRMEKRLRQRAITSVEQLCSLSLQQMHDIWGGIGGDRYAAWLKGEEVDLPETHRRSIGHSHVLEPELRNTEGVLRTAKHLAAKAALRLRRMDYWAGGFSIAVRFRDRTRWERFVKLDEIRHTPAFLSALESCWKEFETDAVPTWVGVTLAPLISPRHHIPSLFQDDKREKLSSVMDAINEKHGKGTALYADLFYKKKETQEHNKIAFSRVPHLWEFK